MNTAFYATSLAADPVTGRAFQRVGEVSDATLARERNRKARLYAAAGECRPILLPSG